MVLKSFKHKLYPIYAMIILSRTPHSLWVFIGWDVDRSNSLDLQIYAYLLGINSLRNADELITKHISEFTNEIQIFSWHYMLFDEGIQRIDQTVLNSRDKLMNFRLHFLLNILMTINKHHIHTLSRITKFPTHPSYPIYPTYPISKHL